VYHIRRWILPWYQNNSGESRPFLGISGIFPEILGNPADINLLYQEKEFVSTECTGNKQLCYNFEQLRNAMYMKVDCCCARSVVLVYNRVCSRPSVFTSRRDTASNLRIANSHGLSVNPRVLALVSWHTLLTKILFLVQKFNFCQIPKTFWEYLKSLENAGIPQNSFGTREGLLRNSYFHVSWKDGRKGKQEKQKNSTYLKNFNSFLGEILTRVEFWMMMIAFIITLGEIM